MTQIFLSIYLTEGATEAIVVVLPVVDNDTDEEILNVQLTNVEGYKIDSEVNNFFVKIVDDLSEPKSNLVSGTSGDDLSITGIDFDGVGNTIFTGAGNDEIDLLGGSKNRVDAGSGDDVIYIGKKDRVLGGTGSDQFWIVNGQIPESLNTIIDFEVGSDVIGILGNSSLGIDVSTLELNEVNGNTEINFNGQTLAILNSVIGLNIGSNVLFA
ncbi:MAG: hypothetical protein AAFR83_02760 [Cyanobacteria bacterium J06629_18]